MWAENAGPAALALPLLWLPCTAESTSGGRTGESAAPSRAKGTRSYLEFGFYVFLFCFIVIVVFETEFITYPRLAQTCTPPDSLPSVEVIPYASR